MWNTLIIHPLTTILHTLFTFTGDIGLAIIFFTILIKTVLLPINISANRATKNMKKIQPHLEELKKKHKGDHRTLGMEMSKLYKEHNIKPFSGILALLVQIPILLGLYMILVSELKIIPDHITFLNIDITQSNIYLAILTFISMYYLMSLSVKDMVVAENASTFQKDFTRMMSMQMKYFLPLIVFITSIFLPAGLTLYFVVSNLFGIFQFLLIKRIVK